MITPKIEKDKLAIVVVGYNKPIGLSRLLSALNSACYETDDVPLVISIDASGNEKVYSIARNFEWKHGTKYVNIETERLGLKKHIFQCGSFTRFFKGVIVLEDDLFVSPFFYHYSCITIEKYGNNEKVAGISLYSEETNGFVGLPFQPVVNGFDVFAWQTVCSWGEIWNERMWNSFISWLDKWDGNFEPIDMIDRIKQWSRAWSKYYYAYMILNDKYFIYPYQALSTNFNDAGGEHGGGNTSIVQVSLIQGKKEYQLGDFEDLVKYDVYVQNMSIAKWLNIETEDLTVDFYGQKDIYRGHYILAPFDLPYKKIKGFALSMRPWELNLKYNIEGNDLFLYYRKEDTPISKRKQRYPLSMAPYFLRGFNMKLLRDYCFYDLKKAIKRKLHLNG